MNGGNFSDIYGSCPSTTAGGLVCNLDSAASLNGNISMEDNAFLNSPFAPLLNGNATGGSWVFRSNFLNRWNIRYPGAHAEAYSPNGVGSQSLNDFSFNALIGSTGVQGSGSVPLPTGLTFFHTISNTKIDHNVNIDPFVGGGPRGVTSISVCVGGAPPTGGPPATTCDTSTPGSNIYVTSIAAGAGVPQVAWSGLVFGAPPNPLCDGITFALSTSISGTTSSGIGGGFTGGIGAVFGADLDVPAAYGATGSIAPEGDGVHGVLTVGTPGVLVPQIGYVLTAGGSSFTITGVASGGNANFGPWLVTPSATVASGALSITIGNSSAGGWVAYPGGCSVTNPEPAAYASGNGTFMGMFSANTSSEVIGNYTDESATAGGFQPWAANMLFARLLRCLGQPLVIRMSIWAALSVRKR